MKEKKSSGQVSAAGPAVKVSAAVPDVPEILVCHAGMPEARAAAVVHTAVAEAAAVHATLAEAAVAE